MTSRLSLYVFPALLAACALLTVTGSAGLPENVAIHFNVKNAFAGLGDGAAATAHRRKGANPGSRILARDGATGRNGTLPVSPFVLAWNHYRRGHLWHSPFDTARERGGPGDTVDRPVIDNVIYLHLRAGLVVSQFSSALQQRQK